MDGGADEAGTKRKDGTVSGGSRALGSKDEVDYEKLAERTKDQLND